MNTLNFNLGGLTCEACIKLSTSRLKKIPGVEEVSIDLKTGKAMVTSTTNLDLDIIKQSLADTTYTVTTN